MTSRLIAFLDVDGTVIHSGELIAHTTIEAVRGANARALGVPQHGARFRRNLLSIDAQSSSDFGSMFAMSLVALFVIFLVGQRYLLKGFVTTGIK